MAIAIDQPSRTTTIVLWVLRLLMAALFLFAAFAKLTSQPQMVEGFGLLPVGQ
jgi:putative oxidoreductase